LVANWLAGDVGVLADPEFVVPPKTEAGARPLEVPLPGEEPGGGGTGVAGGVDGCGGEPMLGLSLPLEGTGSGLDGMVGTWFDGAVGAGLDGTVGAFGAGFGGLVGALFGAGEPTGDA
jgi:hypothetical protein